MGRVQKQTLAEREAGSLKGSQSVFFGRSPRSAISRTKK
ncbi:hypothetical protein CHCC5022_4219 [Bacillus paralicheniformis]|nr:hypothetical protein CHCC5022_4219 [Bacillus paralicheniformis]TWJ82210.1 hypothetical protein CHCC4186_1871 [Bacillus paralicheniformis]